MPEEIGQEPDPTQERVGVHLLSDFGEGYAYVSEEPSIPIVVELMEGLDWERGFFQVIVTLAPGVSMELGGSLNGVDGLSGVYRNRAEQLHLVTSVPPDSVEDMVEIMQSFIRKDGLWQDKYQFS